MKPVNREKAAAGRPRAACLGRLGDAAAGAVPEAARRPLRELMDDALLDRSRDQAGGLLLTGEGSMLGDLVRAVLERALEAELTAHLGYEKSEWGRVRGWRERPQRQHLQDRADRCRAGAAAGSVTFFRPFLSWNAAACEAARW